MSVTHCTHCGAPRKAGDTSCSFCSTVYADSAQTVRRNAPAGFPPGVVEALDSDNLIEAIRVYREANKCSLLDAKTAVEALAKARKR